ncbi:MAG: methylated-DNA--[protein]-cysteine S-methyltransferase [Elusimicrobiales bacterium]|nr:methylated-DNA--[protein]-cysteine S-methyltransferase [Elusimicrobiales bacterium]
MLKMMKTLPAGCVLGEMESPVGKLAIVASDAGLHTLVSEKDREEAECKKILQSLKVSGKHPIVAKTKTQLTEYFAGKRFKFDIPLVLDGTPFQKLAWKQLLAIPYGETVSYGEQARRLGDAKKARAVGGANARNPVGIIVPCHRVVGKDGDLTGFAWGMDMKTFLLKLEKTAKQSSMKI